MEITSSKAGIGDEPQSRTRFHQGRDKRHTEKENLNEIEGPVLRQFSKIEEVQNRILLTRHKRIDPVLGQLQLFLCKKQDMVSKGDTV